jgi:hypothetical protein
MKRKDLGLIAIVVIVSAGISFFVSNMVFGSPSSHQDKVEVVQPITADFPAPDNRYFNKNAFDPTKVITIGQNQNPDPFNGTQ